MPVKNAEKYLEKAIISVLSQGTEIELIAIDDGSEDCSAEILCALASSESRIKAYYISESLGVAAIRNIALEYAQGEYIAFCDADDTVPNGAYLALLSAIKDNDLAIGSYKNAYDDGSLSDTFKVSKSERKSLFQSVFSVGCLWNKLFRHSFIVDNRLRFDTEMKIGEDVVFLASAVMKSPSYSVTDATVYFHWHHNLMQHTSLTHIYTFDAFLLHIKCREKLLSICKDLPGVNSYVYKTFSCFLVDFLAFMPSTDERKKAFFIFKNHILSYSPHTNPDLFFALFGVRLSDFFVMDDTDYFRERAAYPVRERILAEFSCGMIGFRWIWKYFCMWIKYKIGKRK